MNPLFRPISLFIATALMLTTATVATATETRLEALQSPTGVKDESHAFTFPAIVNEHSVALIELGRATNVDAYGGAFTKFGGNSYGLFLSRDDSLMTENLNPTVSLVDQWLLRAASNADADAAIAILPEPERPVDFFFGQKTGGNSAWGLRAAFAGYTQTSENDDGPTDKSKAEASQLDLYFGYSMLGAERMDIGVKVGVLGTLKKSTENETAGTESEHSFKRGLEIGLVGRKMLSGGRRRPFVAAGLTTLSPKVEADNGATSENAKFSETDLRLQGGYLARLPDGLIHADLTLLYVTSKGPKINDDTGVGTTNAAAPSILTADNESDSSKRTTTALVTSLGLESKVYEDWGFLGGMSYSLWGSIKEDDGTADGEPKSEVSVPEVSDANLWALGLFFKNDSVRADATYLKAFLHNGPNFISGNTTPPMLVRISLAVQI